MNWDSRYYKLDMYPLKCLFGYMPVIALVRGYYVCPARTQRQFLCRHLTHVIIAIMGITQTQTCDTLGQHIN